MPTELEKRTLVVVNATHLGRKLDGIGVYALSLLKGLSGAKPGFDCLVLLNRNAEEHVRDIEFPENIRIHWTSARFSHDYGFKGHILRFIHANLLPFLYRRSLIFSMSQMEATFLRHPQITTVHDIIPLLFPDEYRLQHFYFKHLLGRTLRNSSAIVTTTAHNRELLGSHYGVPAAKVRVIPLAAQEIYRGHAADDSARENFILYSGRARGHKNVRGLLEAFNLIKDKTDHDLVIVGSANERELAEYRDGGILDEARVRFAGYVSSGELRDFYMKARLFVWPSFYEGFGLPPLEAMTCGCPLVVSEQARALDVVGEAAVFVDPGSPKSIADGIMKVLNDASLRAELSRKGLERAAMFSWERTTREHIELIEEVLGGV